jgi:hypothetical protein
MTEADVLDRCREGGVSISAIEPLKSGGTHLVCKTSEGADEIRLRLMKHIIHSAVQRHRFYRPDAPA